MAHQLAIKANGQAAMAFVGETPWHNLGQAMPEGASILDWAQAAGFDWKAQASTSLYVTPDGQIRENCEKKVIFRSDTHAPLGTVGADYNIVQPMEMLEFFRDLTEKNEWHIHTAGVMLGGRRLWALARNHTEGAAADGDDVRGNLLLATSLDGTMKTVAAMTAVRVVCANTLKLALDPYRTKSGGVKSSDKKKDGTRDAIAISHRSEFDADAVKRDLGVMRQAFDGFIAHSQEMAQTPIQFEEAREVLRTLFGKPLMHKDAPTVTSVYAGPTGFEAAMQADTSTDFARLLARPLAASTPALDPNIKREQKSVARCLELFNGEAMGADHAGSKGTRWGLFNAITQHIDHEKGRTDDGRVYSAWFGEGHKTKEEALHLLAPALATNA